MIFRRSTLMASLLMSATFASLSPSVFAASHREAPLMALDPSADITDVYAFLNYNDPNRVTLIMNAIPMQEPSAGPNYFFFDPNVLYKINVDLNGDGMANELSFEVRFQTQIRNSLAKFNLPSPVANAGRPEIGQITALNGPGSEGLGLRQSYTVTMVKKAANGSFVRTQLKATDGQPLFAVPSNQGPFTMPDYEALATQGIRTLNNDARVFAGQRDESFYIDVGAAFDGPLNLRRSPVMSDAEDADDTNNFGGVDMLSGLNVNTIAIEIPKALVTPSTGNYIGVYANTLRPKVTVLRATGGSGTTGPFVQVSRMGNPLVNELLIRFENKDRWNASKPTDDSKFIADFKDPTLARVINILYGVPIPAAPRNDLVSALLQYPGNNPGAISDLLRLNVNQAPTPVASQKRLGILAHDASGNPTPDPAAWPNGRRPNDDVTDIALRVVSGVLLGTGNNRLGDGVNYNIGAPGTDVTANGIKQSFPFLPTPFDGRDRRHIDPGE